MNRQFQNFCEYKLRGSQNRCFFPNFLLRKKLSLTLILSEIRTPPSLDLFNLVVVNQNRKVYKGVYPYIITMETTTCQICEREIKAKKGLIAHHGYTRPEQGWQTDSCMGARQLSYEKSRDIIPKAIQQINNFIGLKEAEIKEVEKGEVAVPFLKGKVEPTHAGYKIRQSEYLAKLNYEIKLANREIDRLQKRYGEWRKV